MLLSDGYDTYKTKQCIKNFHEYLTELLAQSTQYGKINDINDL